jgi:hypothetical protein
VIPRNKPNTSVGREGDSISEFAVVGDYWVKTKIHPKDRIGDAEKHTNLSHTLFVWVYQQNQQPSSSVFSYNKLANGTFSHSKPAKRIW